MSERERIKEFLPQQIVEFFEYLDDLRESRVTNMYRAGPYLQSAFDMDRDDARAVLGAWMDTFSQDTPDVRARKALLP